MGCLDEEPKTGKGRCIGDFGRSKSEETEGHGGMRDRGIVVVQSWQTAQNHTAAHLPSPGEMGEENQKGKNV